ncbi:MarR family transcriptional regulator [Clostridiaceae bacterium HSG29]|nr:MarR family transcriptional regulator [Clostridiaceae bacterium HSG29]
MVKISEALNEIFEHKSIFEKVFFENFIDGYSFPKELNQTHIRTILMLYFKDSCPMAKISEKTNLKKGSFTSVANKLIKLGYIEKNRDKIDKRVYKLNLTQKGKKIASEVGIAHNEYVNNLFKGLSSKEKTEYFKAIERINILSHKIMDNKI